MRKIFICPPSLILGLNDLSRLPWSPEHGGLMLRISSKTGGKLACRRDWLLHSLVVRRVPQRPSQPNG
jgi:hypothetical protein